MGRLRLTLFVLLMCEICTGTVKLNVWFLMDIEFSASKSFSVFSVTPEVIWRNLKRSEILRGHLASYTAAFGTCDLQGVKTMMSNFTTKDISKVHAFIGPICSYICGLTGMISSAYSIPQVISCIFN